MGRVDCVSQPLTRADVSRATTVASRLNELGEAATAKAQAREISTVSVRTRTTTFERDFFGECGDVKR